MIKELSDLGKRIREANEGKGELVHNSLKEEQIGIVLTIREDGSFSSLSGIDKVTSMVESVSRTSGVNPRLLVDNFTYIFGFYDPDSQKFKDEVKKKGEKTAIEKMKADGDEKKKAFIEKILSYSSLQELHPVIRFYQDNKKNGIDNVRQEDFLKIIDKKNRSSNICFLIVGESNFLHTKKTVYNEIINRYDRNESLKMEDSNSYCSICGEKKYPIPEIHDSIKNVPDGQSTGCALVSFNASAFESYNLERNLNSSICSNCAKTYVEGLNWLLNNGTEVLNDKGKPYKKYSNRKTFGSLDTAMVYWLKDGNKLDDLDLLEEPDEGAIEELFKSVVSGDSKSLMIKDDYFYSFTLSGAAARIAVRDWFETSLYDVKKSMVKWFENIRIKEFDYSLGRMVNTYCGIYRLAKSVQNEKNTNDVTLSRVIVYLWKAALSQKIIPIWVLNALIKRIRIDSKGVNRERAALIRLILNQNKGKGGLEMKECLDPENLSTAYICGRIFCVLENLQRSALGKNLNAGIRERFFSSAATTPSAAFGRLMKMAQNHLSKLKGEKPGLAVLFDKELQQLVLNIDMFPVLFTLEEQGQFAIGYYHQKQETFKKAAENKELKEHIED